MNDQDIRDRLEHAVHAAAAEIRSWGGPTADFAKPRVTFKNKQTRTSGEARYRPEDGRIEIMFNLAYAEKHADELVERTAPHEVAHAACFHLAHNDCISLKEARSHGKVWKGIMKRLGADPSRCHNMRGVKPRRQKRRPYVCGCSGRVHEVSTVIHNRIAKGRSYSCRDCRTPIRPKR